jgi:hypothetical protein
MMKLTETPILPEIEKYALILSQFSLVTGFFENILHWGLKCLG